MKQFLINALISKKTKALNGVVQHYKGAYLPEIKEYTGFSKSEHLQRAKEALENFNRDVNFYYEHKRFDLLDFDKYEILNYLRAYAFEQRIQADDFKDNPFVKYSSLRRSVLAIQELVKQEPKLGVYSNHCLASSKPIKIL